jgi:geranylgeranyl pyrophosphate synthase
MTNDGGFLAYWHRTRRELDEALVAWVPRLFQGVSEEGAEAIHQALAGGKRLRGTLLCLAGEALGGRRADALPRAVAIECIQAASLLHDDFVDRDPMRRGRPAAWKTHGPRRAVLLGDLMFATALARMVEVGRDDGLATAEVIATMASGAWQETLTPEELDALLITDGEGGQDLYPRIIYLKTGALFGAATRLGALGAGAEEALVRQAFDFGVHLGEAYQIADDLADTVVQAEGLVHEGARDPGVALPGPDYARLAPALMHFCGSEALPPPLSPDEPAAGRWIPADTLERLRSRMHEAIDERLDRAAGSIRTFPENPLTHLLEEAPPRVVAVMLEGGR